MTTGATPTAPVGPASAGAATLAAAAGAPRIPIAITRQKTSKSRLKIRWDYPVYKPEALAKLDWETVSVQPDKALPREEAFRAIAKDDPRPLLILRECQACVGSEVALLSTSAENDRTLLLARWFHCVKLPPDVLREDHPFRHVFPEEEPPHLLLARRDGSSAIPLSGAQSQGDLWDSMHAALRADYAKDPEKAVNEILKLLAHYDALDGQIVLQEDRLDEAIEKEGPDSSKARSIRKDIQRLEKEKKEALAREEKAADLGLKVASPAAPAR
ncbi:MAG: hypothetical protein EYC70_15500 [Planctomycetota bacterium]|nr:MAG: hypothetical protein EYC70_15500 [Planctomycetota bacterium]